MPASTYAIKRRPDRYSPSPEAKSRLKQLDIELTERCNNNCIHCLINRPVDDEEARSREMTTGQVLHILRQAAALGCLQVRFTGGEPLLRPDFEDLYLYARRLGLKVSLFTNARLITPSLAGLFARIPLLVPIEVTVYGMNRESCQAVTRARDSYGQYRRGLELLLSHGVPFVVRWVMLPQNKHEMPEFEAWAGTIPGMTGPPSYVVSLDMRSRRDDAARNALIESLRLPPREALALICRDEAKYRRDMGKFATRFMGPTGDRLFSCGAGQSVCVDAYGYAQPCMGLRSPDLTCKLITGPEPDRGNEALSLADALDRFRQLRGLRAENPEYLRRCAKCFLRGLCEQCPAKSWSEHGNLDTPVACLCEAAHVKARRLGLLGETEFGWEVVDWQERIHNAFQETALIGNQSSE
ncbi:MAG: radical SAM protein [Proteobacteria bacterium]|nr:radical SAM protein [Pseudomonadota bacterium]